MGRHEADQPVAGADAGEDLRAGAVLCDQLGRWRRVGGQQVFLHERRAVLQQVLHRLGLAQVGACCRAQLVDALAHRLGDDREVGVAADVEADGRAGHTDPLTQLLQLELPADPAAERVGVLDLLVRPGARPARLVDADDADERAAHRDRHEDLSGDAVVGDDVGRRRRVRRRHVVLDERP